MEAVPGGYAPLPRFYTDHYLMIPVQGCAPCHVPINARPPTNSPRPKGLATF